MSGSPLASLTWTTSPDRMARPRRRRPVGGLRERAPGRFDLLRRAAVVGHEVDERAVELIEPGEVGLAEPRGRGGDGLEGSLDAGGGAADDAEDLGRRRLLLT